MKPADESFVPLDSVTRAGGGNDFDPASESSRRRFLEIMGASLAMTSLAGCTRQPTEYIMPYVEPPEEAIPGRPAYYATAALVNGLAEGLVVESHLGRPTKAEGNPNHPASLGATSVHGQACVLDLYDPDRAREVREKNEIRDWEAFRIEFTRLLMGHRKTGGSGLAILTETVTSPSLGAQIAAVLAALPKTRWFQFEPASGHSAHQGAMMAFGRPVNTYYRLDRADVILAIDSNFLACGQGSTRYARDFADRRRVRGSNTAMNRLYSIECEMTSTGGKADHRLPMRYGEIESFVRQLNAILAGGVPPQGVPYAESIAVLARDLQAQRGACAIIPGEHQSPAVHALVHHMNAVLGNVGTTVIYTDPLEASPVDQIASLRDLVAAMNGGQVLTLILLGGNPVFTSPNDIAFGDALAKVPTSVHVSLHDNETTARSRWVIPARHFLEDWSDARAHDGTVTILQPLIEPLYTGRSSIEILDMILGQSRISREIVRDYWTANAKASDFESWWRKSVRTGVVADSALPPITPPAKGPAGIPAAAATGGGLDLLIRTDPYIFDGRYANNAWLQELPKPITKLTWDNVVQLSPRTAKRLGLENERLVDLTLQGRTVRGPVWISAGQADDTAIVHLGYGRKRAGRVGNGTGFDVYPLRTSDTLWAAGGAEIRAAGGSHRLATTQTHYDMEGHALAISAPVATYIKDPEFARREIDLPEKEETIYYPWDYPGYAWGMSIDMTSCVNCMACVIACQAENNIPVVGRDQQLVNRALHWLRVDVYAAGNPEKPTMTYQPVPCMHCENAPCELVCPVAATTHSSDGLNEMTYNRCIGTRYCSNNCPYKVRHFNFFLYNDWITEQLKLQRNPDVTVRSRGVMEKCTYCVQRIREAEIHATVENRQIRDGEIQTACQQVCPAKAIIFGDIRKSGNQVAQLKAEKLDYPLLGELNTRPRTTYLAELRNPNPEWKESGTA